jgi:Ca2+-binding EF-hand superfamily protein
MTAKSKMIRIAAAAILMVSVSFVASSQTNDHSQKNQNGRQGPPKFEELLEKMDTNKDGMLAKSEVKGPLLENFTNVDKNEDGLITKAELESMPKPKGNRRPKPE